MKNHIEHEIANCSFIGMYPDWACSNHYLLIRVLGINMRPYISK